MKRILLSLIFCASTFALSAQPINKHEHEAFVQGYMQSLRNDQLKLRGGSIEFYHRRSLIMTALLSAGVLGGVGTAVVPMIVATDGSLECFLSKVIFGVVGTGLTGMSVYQLLKMYSSTPLVVLSNEGLQVPGSSLVRWADIAEVAITENIEDVTSGSKINNSGFISGSLSSTKRIVHYGVMVKNKYGQTVYSELENVLPVESSSFCTLVNSYRAVYGHA
jgi:hypothetical protein